MPEEVRGKLVKCQFCQTMFRVPDIKRGGTAGRNDATGEGQPNQPMKKSA